jgi:hypothetical protein
MSARYRHIWLVLDPFSGTRAPPGALVDSGDGVEFVPAPVAAWRHLTDRQRLLAAWVVEDLDRAVDFDGLPIGAGPHVVADPPVVLPAVLDHPAVWVRSRILERLKAA